MPEKLKFSFYSSSSSFLIILFTNLQNKKDFFLIKLEIFLIYCISYFVLFFFLHYLNFFYSDDEYEARLMIVNYIFMLFSSCMLFKTKDFFKNHNHNHDGIFLFLFLFF